MTGESLIDNELFVISVFLLGIPLILAVLLSKDYSNITEFLKYTFPFVVLELVGIILAICILAHLFLKICHFIQYLLVRAEMSRFKQKEKATEQNQKDNITNLSQELQTIFLEAKPLLNAENTLENKQKLEKISNKILQPKYNDLALHKQRLHYIQNIGNKLKEINNYLQSKEKAEFNKKKQIKNKLGIEKGYFKKANLNEEEIQILLEDGFSEYICIGLDDKRTYSYLLKNRRTESTQHFFLTRIVSDFIASLRIKVRTPESVEADIIEILRSKISGG